MRWACILSIVIAFPATAQQLGPILYTDWGRLCSVAPADTVRVCVAERRQFQDVVWSPKGKRLVAGGGAILDASGKRIGSLRGFSGIRPVWAPDGRHVFALSYDVGSAVQRWDREGRRRTTIPVEGGTNERGRRFQWLSFSPSGRRAALLTMQFREMVIADVQSDKFTVSSTAPANFRYVSQSVWLDDNTLLFVGKRQADSLGALWRLDVPTGAVDSVGITGLALRDQILIAPDRRSVVVTAAAVGKKTLWNLWYFDLSSKRTLRLTSGTEDIAQSWR